MSPVEIVALNSVFGDVMSDGTTSLSRISKLLVDREQITPEAVLARREQFAVTLSCGEDVAESYTLQLALLTAARIAVRCFPGAVHVSASAILLNTSLRLWPRRRQSIGEALAEIIGKLPVAGEWPVGRSLIFGNAAAPAKSLRVTFDGWTAQVGPTADLARLPERELFPATGILAASLALSELFLSFAEISIQATRRVVGLSLWRPDLAPEDPAAFGERVEYLPSAQWLLGLGHLGNCYLWALSALPYADPDRVEFALFDFDAVEDTNVETCLIVTPDDVGNLKTRICASWLQARGFKTRLVERRFDGTFRRQLSEVDRSEPGLAFCGFDSNPPRRDLVTAKFARIVECGLGAMAHNFDTLSLHTLPHRRPPAELWPDLTPDQLKQVSAEQDRIARENPGYADLARDECGRALLAGKAVGVPFVGATAAAFAVAEAVRLLHGGPAFSDLKLNLGNPSGRAATRQGNYDAEALKGVRFTTSASGWSSTS